MRRMVTASLICGWALCGWPARGQERPGPNPLPPEDSVWNPYQAAAGNQPLKVKVLVLNYDPLVPSEKNRRLSEVFGWGAPERLAARYQSEMEFASGGYLKFEIVEWRNLNEIYPQRDGYRYTPDEYTAIRRNGKGWHEGGGQDYPRVLAEQEVLALIDAGQVDEVWIFSDHFFGLWEASMAGPGAFFINGGVYPEVPSKRPFAFYGFNYERGVAEMMHDAAHRTEATLNRVYGGWNLKEPMSNWDKFSANDQQSFGVAGVGNCHWPANANGDYDYGNERIVQSWADDYLNYPKLAFTKKPVSRSTWSRGGDNFHLDYMSWYFAHVPRAAGINPDGRQNNWWKYIMDFQNYTADGQPKPLGAQATARDVFVPRGGEQTVTVAYSGAIPVDVSSIDGNDLVVTGPGGYKQSARLVAVSDRENGTHRVATYAVASPAGGWNDAHRGTYRIAAQPSEIRDVVGQALAAGDVGAFQVRSAESDEPAINTLKAEVARLDLPVTRSERIRIKANGKTGTESDVTADVVWTSQNRKVAVVDQTGLIRGVAAGTTTVTATLGKLVENIQVAVKETGIPGARLGKAEDFSVGGTRPYQFSVIYTDDEVLSKETIGFGDVRVTGPNGFQQFARFVALDQSTDPRVGTATYRVFPRGGTWWSSANGEYAIEVKGWQVGDNKGQYVPDGRLGTFNVTVREGEPAGMKPPTVAPKESEPSRQEKRPRNAGRKKAKLQE